MGNQTLKMTKYLLAWMLLVCSLASAQTKSDSLLTLHSASNNWNEKAELTYEFCKLNLGANPDKCLALYKDVEAHIPQVTDSVQLFNLYNVEGIIYQYRHEVDSSNTYLLHAKDIAIALGDSSLMVKSVGNISINYRNIGEYLLAINQNLSIVPYYKAQHDTIRLAGVYSEIANSYLYMENYQEGMTYQRAALKLSSAVNYWQGMGSAQSSLAYGYEKLDQLDSSIYFLKKAIKNNEKSGNTFSMEICQRMLCTNLVKLNASEDSIYQCHLNVLVLSTQNKNKEGMMIDYLNLSRNLNNMDKFEEALEYTFKSLELGKELGDKRVMNECFASLSIRYFNLEQFKLAYKYSDSTRTLNDELRNLDIQNAVLEADKKFQVAEKEKELSIANQEKAEVALIAEKRKTQMGMLAGSAFLLLAAGAFLLYKSKQQAKSRLAQIRIEEQQKGLSAVIEAEETERKRIAKDLHDGIVQQLGGLKLGMEKMFADKETEQSQKIVKILDDSTQELRELSHRMMPRALGELGMIPALGDMLENSLGQTNIEYQFEHFGLSERIKENIEIAIYRIAQELVNNVIKHSDANKVNIQLFKTGSDVILIIEDDGKGLDTKSQKNGIGLMNISSRLDVLHGRVNFEPSPESGTLATVKIPLDK